MSRKRAQATVSSSMHMVTRKRSREQNLSSAAKIVEIGDGDLPKSVAQRIQQTLLQHGIVALKTDTLYGICCLADSDVAIKKLYEAKQRDTSKAISVCVGTHEKIGEIFGEKSVEMTAGLVEETLPGPYTFIFRKAAGCGISELLNQNNDYLGVRIPDDHLVREICNLVNRPLALTSANLSGQKSPLEISDFQEIWPSLDLILDGGKITKTGEDRAGSTIVKFSGEGEEELTCSLVRRGVGYEKLVPKLRARKFLLKNFVDEASSY